MRHQQAGSVWVVRRAFQALLLVATAATPQAFAQAAKSVAAPVAKPAAAPVAKPAAAPAATGAAGAKKVDGSTELVTFTSKMVNGKKTWLPAEVHVKNGHHIAITLKNELPEPHGFQIVGLVEPVVVGPHETKTVLAVPTKPGTYKATCQLHPAHVGATLIVD
jgi:hypothetical protein